MESSAATAAAVAAAAVEACCCGEPPAASSFTSSSAEVGLAAGSIAGWQISKTVGQTMCGCTHNQGDCGAAGCCVHTYLQPCTKTASWPRSTAETGEYPRRLWGGAAHTGCLFCEKGASGKEGIRFFNWCSCLAGVVGVVSVVGCLALNFSPNTNTTARMPLSCTPLSRAPTLVQRRCLHPAPHGVERAEPRAGGAPREHHTSWVLPPGHPRVVRSQGNAQQNEIRGSIVPLGGPSHPSLPKVGWKSTHPFPLARKEGECFWRRDVD